jgi:Ala-tRNA(Pro) deacylase
MAVRGQKGAPAMTVPSSITTYLKAHRVHYAVVQHPVAYTAQEEAAVMHVPGRAWAKTVICLADGEPVFAVLPATHQVDLDRLRSALKARILRLAAESELQTFYSDCEVGAMPPFGPLYGHRVLVDSSLTADPEIVFNAGSHREAIRMTYGDFAALVKPVVAEFAAPAHVH